MGLETTALIHYPCFSYSDPPKMQVWLPSYLKPINGPHFSPSSSFKNANSAYGKSKSKGAKGTNLSEHSPRERTTISIT